jgi:hypothetical protein
LFVLIRKCEYIGDIGGWSFASTASTLGIRSCPPWIKVFMGRQTSIKGMVQPWRRLGISDTIYVNVT